MNNSLQDKQQLLREKILDKDYDPQDFFNFMDQSKGANLELYTLEEIDDVVEQFISSQRIPKQEYLTDEIANKNYDINSFMDHMRQQKINGDNIDNWTLEELKEVVWQFQVYNKALLQNFKDLNQSQQQYNQNRGDLLRNSMIKQNNQDPVFMDFDEPQIMQSHYGRSQIRSIRINESQKILNPIKENLNEGFENSNIQQLKQMEQNALQKPFTIKHRHSDFKYKQEFYIKKVPVTMQESALPKNNKLKITIPHWERKSGLFGIFGKHLLYEVNTSPFEWRVQRRYDDFVAFRQILTKLFPGKLLPPLDNYGQESTESEAHKRVQFLQQFCNHLKNNPEVWSNSMSKKFFSEKKPWEEIQEQFNQQKIDNKWTVTSPDGLVELRLAKENYIYKNEAAKHIEWTQHQYHDLQKETQKLADDFKKISKQFTKVNQIHQNLVTAINEFTTNITKKLPDSEEFQEIVESNKYFEKSLKNMQNLISGWSKQSKQQGQLLDYMQNLYSFQELSYASTKDMIKSYNQSENKYLSCVETIQNKLQRGETIQEKMKEEKNLLQDEFAYWSQKVYQEGQDLITFTSNDYTSFFNYFARFQTLSINEVTKSWGKVINEYFDNPLPVPKNQGQQVDLMQSMIKKF